MVWERVSEPVYVVIVEVVIGSEQAFSALPFLPFFYPKSMPVSQPLADSVWIGQRKGIWIEGMEPRWSQERLMMHLEDSMHPQ